MSSSLQDNLDSPFLQRAALASLRHLRFVPPTPGPIAAGAAMPGEHRSRRPGGAAEFFDARAYVPGDDVRRLDWKLLARTGRPFVRRFLEDATLRVTLMLDASASMEFDRDQGPTKAQSARFILTALSEIIARQQDQVGLAIAGDGLEKHLLPTNGPSHARHLQTELAAATAARSSKLDVALAQLRAADARPGMLLIASDFLIDDLPTFVDQLHAVRAARWTIALIHLVHPNEEHLPSGPAWQFDGLEDGDGDVQCSPDAIAAEYEARFEGHVALVHRLALAAGCDHRRVSTARPYLDTVRGYLVPRGGG